MRQICGYLALFTCFGLGCRTTQGTVSGTNERPADVESGETSRSNKSSSAKAKSSLPVLPTNELQLQQSCERPVELLETQYILRFPARKGCSFGVAPHKSAQAGLLRAFASTSQSLPLPKGQEPCALRVALSSPHFSFRDGLQVLVQSHLLYSSQSSWLDSASSPQSYPPVAPSNLYDSRLEADPKAYCGAAAPCIWPLAASSGPVSFDQRISGGQILQQAKVDGEIFIQLNAWGDKDSDDCAHEELTGTLWLYGLSTEP